MRPQSLPQQVVFGEQTVVYGHDGSGKPTLANLLGAVGAGSHDDIVMWHRPDGTSHRVPPGDTPPEAHISAFTTSWVRANLTSFLSGEGRGAGAIVTLGSEAVEAAAEISAEEQRLTGLDQQQKALGAEVQAIDAMTREECRRVQHGEGRQVVEPLEASVVLHEISRCTEFIRAVDEPRHLAMMRATGRGEDQVILLPDGDPAEVRADAPAPPPTSGPRR